MLGRDRYPIRGRVVAVRRTKTFGGGSIGPLQSEHEFVVEYKLEGEEPQRVKLKEKHGKMWNPAEGDTVPLLIDRKSGNVRWDLKDPKLNLKARLNAKRDAEKSEFDAKLKR